LLKIQIYCNYNQVLDTKMSQSLGKKCSSNLQILVRQNKILINLKIFIDPKIIEKWKMIRFNFKSNKKRNHICDGGSLFTVTNWIPSLAISLTV
jgi:hypothetical protein